MMLGGSPMSVAVPPMFDAMTSPRKNGTGCRFRRRQRVRVTGPTKSTVVTLSRKADRQAVSTMSRAMMRHGRPRAARAQRMARYSKTPDCLTTATNSIMPSSTPRVFRSTWSMACSKDTTCSRSSSTAPASAARARFTFSDMTRPSVPRNTTTEITCATVIEHLPRRRDVPRRRWAGRGHHLNLGRIIGRVVRPTVYWAALEKPQRGHCYPPDKR